MSQFVGYVGPRNLHDGRISAIDRRADEFEVVVRTDMGEDIVLLFHGVSDAKANHPEGMMLYALSEWTAEVAVKRFIFVNWDDADDSSLEVTAAELSFTKADTQTPKSADEQADA